MNISISGINNQNTQRIEQQKTVMGAPNSGKEEKGMTLFAGNMNLGQDSAKEKLESARKQAFKMVTDAWNADRDFQKRLGDLKDFMAEQRTEKSAAKKMKSDAEKTMEALKEEYQPDPESQEQPDLDWLLAYLKKPMEEKLKDIEQWKKDEERAKGIMDNLTDYQAGMLEADERLTIAEQRIAAADDAMMAAAKSYTDAESENRKQHTMFDAKKDGEALVAAAERDVIGTVINDAKEKQDEEIREAQEEKEKKKEEEKEQAKIEAKREEQKEIQEALAHNNREALNDVEARSRERRQDDLDLSDLTDLSPTQMYQNSGQAEAALEELKNKMALIDADLKGLKVDETV